MSEQVHEIPADIRKARRTLNQCVAYCHKANKANGSRGPAVYHDIKVIKKHVNRVLRKHYRKARKGAPA